MNDTILNDRQKILLAILKERNALSRLDISKEISQRIRKPVSKITLVRDLNLLLKLNLIFSEGEARATRYCTSKVNPLLDYIDIDEYFEKDVDGRKIKSSFDPSVFGNLINLYSEEEIKLWNYAREEFKERTKILDKSIYKRELERFVVEFAWKSSQIEGNTYSLLETDTLLTQNIEAKGHTKAEAIMLINHKKAFNLILENKNTFKRLKYSDVLQLHGVLTKGLVSSGIRKQPVRISGTNYIPMSSERDLEDALRLLIKKVNKLAFPPEKALIVSLMLAYIQPFADGNKRTARTLANATLLAYGYFPLSYRNIALDDYRKALIVFYEQNNLYLLKKVFMSQIRYALDNYFMIK